LQVLQIGQVGLQEQSPQSTGMPQLLSMGPHSSAHVSASDSGTQQVSSST
jgi:hypothetical protein